MPNPIFVGKIKAGQVHLDNPHLYHEFLKGMKEDQRVKVMVKPFRAGDNIRSIQANAYYWGVVIEILRNDPIVGGYTKEEMHDALGVMFRQRYDGFIPTVERTSTMSSSDFWEYIETVRRWASTYANCYIPDPNEVEV